MVANIPTSTTVLVIDDDELLNNLICKNLKKIGVEADSTTSGTEAIRMISKTNYFLLMVDYKLPDMTGQQLMGSLIERNKIVPFIMMTGFGDEQVAVEVMKLGARDYLIKDSSLIDSLPGVMSRVFEQLSLEMQQSRTEAELQESQERFRNLFYNSLNGIAFHEIVTDANGSAIDYIFVDVNPAYEDLTGLDRLDIVGRRASEVMPGSENSPLLKTYESVAIRGKSTLFDRYIEELDEHYRVVAFSSRQGEFTTVITDITELRQ